MNDEDPNLCEACLSRDRKLIYIRRIRPLIIHLQITELETSNGCICFECYNSIVKFNKFKCTVRDAQALLTRTLQTYLISLIKLSRKYCKFPTVAATTRSSFYTDLPIPSYTTRSAATIKTKNNSKHKSIKSQGHPAKVTNNSAVTIDQAFYQQYYSFSFKERFPFQNVKPFSSLKVDTINYYDYEFTYNDPLDFKPSLEGCKPIQVKQEVLDDTENVDNIEDVSFKEEVGEKNPSKMLPAKRLVTKKLKAKRLSAKKLTSKKLRSQRLIAKRLPMKRLSETEPEDSDSDDHEPICKEEPESPKRLRPKRLATKRFASKKDNTNKKAAKNESEDLVEITLNNLSDAIEVVLLSEEEMIKHRDDKKNHHNFRKIPYKCDSCVLGFCKKENYDNHMAKKHDESIGPACDVCLVRFSKVSALKSHREQHYHYYKCKLCDYKCNLNVAALNHVREKHAHDSLDKIHCKECNEFAGTREELTKHMKDIHMLTCVLCNEKFKDKNTLRRHQVRTHADKRQFACDVCKKTFMTKSRLESHMTHHSDALAKKMAFCSICNTQYLSIQVYRNHLKNSLNHIQEKFPCPECGKTFASKSYWHQHYNFYHLKQSKFKCEECDKIFLSNWRLINHKQVRHGMPRPRDHGCTVCGKRFYTNRILRAHMQIHSSQRSHMCAICGDTFKQSPALYTHQKLVHGK